MSIKVGKSTIKVGKSKIKIGKSKIARKPVVLPQGFTCFILKKGELSIKDNKGVEHVFKYNSNFLICNVNEEGVKFSFNPELKKIPVKARGFLGTATALLRLSLKEFNEGYSASIKLVGVGYKASFANGVLSLSLGFSHAIKILISEFLVIVAEKDSIKITGQNHMTVMRLCEIVKKLRKPEVYKGSGVFVNGQTIALKQGKKK